jgi:hypothetical protein
MIVLIFPLIYQRLSILTYTFLQQFLRILESESQRYLSPKSSSMEFLFNHLLAFVFDTENIGIRRTLCFLFLFNIT